MLVTPFMAAVIFTPTPLILSVLLPVVVITPVPMVMSPVEERVMVPLLPVENPILLLPNDSGEVDDTVMVLLVPVVVNCAVGGGVVH